MSQDDFKDEQDEETEKRREKSVMQRKRGKKEHVVSIYLPFFASLINSL